MRICLVVAALIFLAVLPSCSHPDTPQQAVIDILRAMDVGDEGAVLSRVWVSDPTLELSARASFAVQAGKARLRHEEIETIGLNNLGLSERMDIIGDGFVEEKEKSVKDAKVTIVGDTATLEIAGSPAKLTRKDGKWKMDLASELPRLTDEVAKARIAEGDFYMRLAADVHDRKLKTSAEVRAAIDSSPYGKVFNTQTKP